MSLTDFFFKWKTFLVEHLIEILVAVFWQARARFC